MDEQINHIAEQLADVISRTAATATTAAELEALAAVAHEYREYCRFLLTC